MHTFLMFFWRQVTFFFRTYWIFAFLIISMSIVWFSPSGSCRRSPKNSYEAITFYLVRFFDSNTYDVKLFEEIQIDGESVREAYIEPSGPVFDGIRSAIDMDMRNRLNKLEDRIAGQEKELEDYTAFVSACKLSHAFGDFVAKEAG